MLLLPSISPRCFDNVFGSQIYLRIYFHLTFVVAQENMNVEAAYMLTRQGMINASTVLSKIQALARRPDEGEEAGYSAKYQDEYKNMSADMIDQLRQIYKWEIYLFDYPDTPFVDFSKA